MHVKGPARRKCLRGVPQPVVTVIPGLGVTAGKQTQKLLPPCPGGMRASGKKQSHFHSEPGSSTLGPSYVGNRHLSWGTDSSDSWGVYRGRLRLACWVSLG